MTSPSSSYSTSTFDKSGYPTIDSLLNEFFQKWGESIGSGASLSFSFPWTNNSDAIWQSNYSSANEPFAAYHYGFSDVQIQAAKDALQAWADVANITFTEIAETSQNVGDFRFAFSSALPETAWGWAYGPNDYWASAADVWVSTAYSNDVDWSAATSNYAGLIHEIGHGLGLKHPGNYGGSLGPYLPTDLDYKDYTIMSYNDPVKSWYWDSSKGQAFFVAPETPMVYDIRAIQYLYGANHSYHTGDDVYSFDPSVPFFKTIWDAGGTDTIDVSNFYQDCRINLTPGSYSDIGYAWPNQNIQTWSYDGTNALGIAFDAIIENAIGGNGDDILDGNAVDNTLVGGSGDDQLFGDLGNDIITGGKGIDSAHFYSVYSNAIITYSLATQSYTITTELDGTDTVNGCEYLQFNDQLVYALFGTVKTNISEWDGTIKKDKLNGTISDDYISGGEGNDILNGYGGDDYLCGSYGKDKLTGNSGADCFVFDTAPNRKANVDRVTDFSSVAKPDKNGVSDRLLFNASIFTNTEFTAIKKLSQAVDTHGFIYELSTGKLYYDDGGGAGDVLELLVVLTGKPALSVADISFF